MKENGLRHAVMRELTDIDEEKDINIKDIMRRDTELARRLDTQFCRKPKRSVLRKTRRGSRHEFRNSWMWEYLPLFSPE